MSTNGDNIPRIPVDCPKCNKHFEVLFPAMEVANNLRFSAIIAAHERLIHCENRLCDQTFIYAITGQYSISFMVAPVNEEARAQVEGTRLVVPELKLM